MFQFKALQGAASNAPLNEKSIVQDKWGEHCLPKGQESVLLCYLQPSDKTKRNVEDVKETPKPEALTNSLEKHTVFWVFSLPYPIGLHIL